MAHLFIIRGLPGSGKTTFARKIMRNGVMEGFFEADQYFTDIDGKYSFNAKDLPKAHAWCLSRVAEVLQEGYTIGVVNTFTRKWEMRPYINFCKENNHTFTVLTCEGNYGNIHGVSDGVIESMRQRWEKV